MHEFRSLASIVRYLGVSVRREPNKSYLSKQLSDQMGYVRICLIELESANSNLTTNIYNCTSNNYLFLKKILKETLVTDSKPLKDFKSQEHMEILNLKKLSRPTRAPPRAKTHGAHHAL